MYVDRARTGQTPPHEQMRIASGESDNKGGLCFGASVQVMVFMGIGYGFQQQTHTVHILCAHSA